MDANLILYGLITLQGLLKQRGNSTEAASELNERLIEAHTDPSRPISREEIDGYRARVDAETQESFAELDRLAGL